MQVAPVTPRILELRGRLAAALGDAPAADRTLRQALELYREIGASGHAERLTGELLPLLGVARRIRRLVWLLVDGSGFQGDKSLLGAGDAPESGGFAA